MVIFVQGYFRGNHISASEVDLNDMVKFLTKIDPNGNIKAG